MARLTRIAVNLLLIVAIAIQPSMAIALQKSCLANCNSHRSCQGCGSCAVDSPGDRCGCCSGQIDHSSNEENSSCCGHGAAQEHSTASTSEDDPFADTELAYGLVAIESLSRRADDQLATSSNRPTVVSTCYCLHAPETPYPPAPRSPANELRELASLEFAFSAIVEPKQQLPSVAAVSEGPPSAILHFAQIEFCVWRL